LVPTLAALVSGAATGLLAEVVVADAGSRDATEEVADIAGCRFMASTEPLGARLKAAATSTRSLWLMFLQAGIVPQVGWTDAAESFMQTTGMLEGAARAAVFRPSNITDNLRPGFAEIGALLRASFGARPKPEQGLLIARRFYDAIGGHPAGADTEKALLREIGRRRLAVLPVAASTPP
jgi:hypothetical protein